MSIITVTHLESILNVVDRKYAKYLVSHNWAFPITFKHFLEKTLNVLNFDTFITFVQDISGLKVPSNIDDIYAYYESFINKYDDDDELETLTESLSKSTLTVVNEIYQELSYENERDLSIISNEFSAYIIETVFPEMKNTKNDVEEEIFPSSVVFTSPDFAEHADEKSVDEQKDMDKQDAQFYIDFPFIGKINREKWQNDFLYTLTFAKIFALSKLFSWTGEPKSFVKKFLMFNLQKNSFAFPFARALLELYYHAYDFFKSYMISTPIISSSDISIFLKELHKYLMEKSKFIKEDDIGFVRSIFSDPILFALVSQISFKMKLVHPEWIWHHLLLYVQFSKKILLNVSVDINDTNANPYMIEDYDENLKFFNLDKFLKGLQQISLNVLVIDYSYSCFIYQNIVSMVNNYTHDVKEVNKFMDDVKLRISELNKKYAC